jgi:hypothetical protein
MRQCDVADWPIASFRTLALNDRSWSNNEHRAAQARNPSVAFDPYHKWNVRRGSGDNIDLCGAREAILVATTRIAEQNNCVQFG